MESTKYQIFSIFSVAYLCISCGNFLGYTSSAVPSIKEDTANFESISHDDISWIGGIGPLGALSGSLFTLLPLSKLGTRKTIFFCGAPAFFASWAIIGFATSVQTIFIGRFIGGIGTGIVIACSPLYVLDIASVKIRGRLGILPQFLMIFGIVTSYILGSFLDWSQLALACGILGLPSIFLLALAPDSPIASVSNSEFDKALKTLEKLHGTKEGPTMLREIEDQLAKRSLIERRGSHLPVKRGLSTAVIKTSAVALGILSFQQLTGINGVTFYAVSIFRKASGNGEMDPHVPSIILACTQLLASFMSTLFVERFGRKVLLTVSATIMSLSCFCLGCYFYFGSVLIWIPLIALIIFTFGFSIGFGPVSWILIAEILPVETRHIMNPLAIAYNWFCVFLVAKSFHFLLLEIQISGIFWLYGGISLLGLLFVVTCIPETKGLSSEEIQNYFAGNRTKTFVVEEGGDENDNDDDSETKAISCDN